jgi:glycerophosphoryl diester phosphodiesterase
MKNILNIAHRGFTQVFPDNTIEAFRAAIETGVDGIEFDVQETADQRFIVYHDAELFGININRLPLTEIKKVKLRGKFRIPTFEETLDVCMRQVKLVVELKQVQSIDAFVQILRMHGSLNLILVASFREDPLSKLFQLAQETHRAIIIGHQIQNLLDIVKRVQADTVIVKYPLANTELIQEVKSNRMSVLLWGCTSSRDIRTALKLGIDGIISDYPNLVSSLLHTRA